MKTSTAILLLILMMGLINGLMSCTSSEVVYKRSEVRRNGMVREWKTMPTKSEMTGWSYNKK